ncbi:MAG: MOMP family protein [Chlamydiia bacterium]|nr:MOMP family protein [Chlamydiia bacterium]
MKKTIITLSLLATSLAFSYKDVDERLDSLEVQMKEISARNPQETLGAAFRTARPETKNTRFFATLDLLYWHPKLGGTDYAYTGEYEVDNSEPEKGAIIRALPPKGDVKENDLGWSLGIRAGLGYKTPHDDWDVRARYTWLNGDDSSSNHKNFPSNLFAMRSIIIIPCRYVKSHIDIKYNNVDLELARSYFVSQNLSIRPHFDIKATWLNLGQKIQYGFSTIVSDFLQGQEMKVTESSRFKGYGPRAGVDAALFLGEGFSLVGEVSGAILYGSFNTRIKETFPANENTGNTPEVLYNVKDNFHRFIPFVHMLLGLKWETYLNHQKQFLHLRGGYEVQYYWRVNQMMSTGGIVSDGARVNANGVVQTVFGSRTAFEPISEDLAFYGLTGEVRLDF